MLKLMLFLPFLLLLLAQPALENTRSVGAELAGVTKRRGSSSFLLIHNSSKITFYAQSWCRLIQCAGPTNDKHFRLLSHVHIKITRIAYNLILDRFREKGPNAYITSTRNRNVTLA